MKIYLALLLMIFSLSVLHAQRIRVNGLVSTHAEVPIAGVAVMAFDKGVMIKSYVTDDKGEFSFYVDRVRFDVLFYKPGMHWHSYGVNNRLDKESQGINISIQMEDSTAETAVDPATWLGRHHLSQGYIDSLYRAEISKVPPMSEKQVRKQQKELMKQALAEQKRFANYKESTVTNSKDSKVTTTVIGPDTYERIQDDKGDKTYVKNHKPITASTYDFETTRRYDGVLKGEKNVKKFDKYEPMEHVK